MPSLYNVSICMLISLMVSFTFSVRGKIAIGPGELVKVIGQFLPEVESYAKLQMKLESIADAHNLFAQPDGSKSETPNDLAQNPDVQKILKECNEFHKQLECKSTVYRSMDGTCNNLKYPKWGSEVTEQGRFLPANYIGSNGFRKSVDGEDLPPVRFISLKLKNRSNPSNNVSALFTFLGQLLTHDMTLTPSMTEQGKPIPCCKESAKCNPSCVPIYYPADDPFYSQFNVTCQGFTRATPFPKCNFEKRSPINKKTSFIDLSSIYGSNDKEAMALRRSDGTGKLKTQELMTGALLPKNHDENTPFCPTKSVEKCFIGGDDRVNQHTMLASLDTIFVRMHNKIAEGLHQLNPQWNDEILFQESRRILTASYQIIVYREYLPQLLGDDYMRSYNLYPNSKCGSLYNDEVNPSIWTEFSTAAFRVHSMIPTLISKFMPRFEFRNSYSNFQPIHRGRMESLVSGSCEVASQKNDPSVVRDVSGYLVKVPGATYGSDLPAVDIQRGRDVGLPPYVDFVRQYSAGTIDIQDFPDLQRLGLMTGENVNNLRDIYHNVRDIDLWIGMIFEEPVQGLDIGPSVAFISALQFYQLKYGDSFYVTHKNGRNPFTKEQLDILKDSSLAQILCHNLNVESMRRYPLQIPNDGNPMLPCTTFPQLDLTHWKEL